MERIPADMIEEIVVKLPVKSLIRFRCVSKSWSSLITDRRFARRHHLNLTNRQHHHSLILECFLPDKPAIHIVEHEDEELASKITLHWGLEHVFQNRLPFPIEFDGKSYEIKGYCDGMLCLVFQFACIVVWNPRIGEYKKITHPDSYLGIREVLGFGYDSSIDDYKVVRAREKFYNSFIVQVLTLKSNSWKTVHHDSPFSIYDQQPATTVNGGIYWFADDASNIYQEKRIALVCFDLAEDKFREVALPPDITKRDIIPRLGLAGDCLCFLTEKGPNTFFDLWVLMGDSTWAKLFTIPKLTGDGFGAGCSFKPVCFAKTGAFLMNVGGEKFLMYDSKDDTFTTFRVQGIQSWYRLIVFVDSLVSPCTSIGTNSAADDVNLTVSP